MSELATLAFQVSATFLLVVGVMIWNNKVQWPLDDEPEWYKLIGGSAVIVCIGAFVVGCLLTIWGHGS